MEQLTAREKEEKALELFNQGMRFWQIGKELHITSETARRYVHNARKRGESK